MEHEKPLTCIERTNSGMAQESTTTPASFELCLAIFPSAEAPISLTTGSNSSRALIAVQHQHLQQLEQGLEYVWQWHSTHELLAFYCIYQAPWNNKMWAMPIILSLQHYTSNHFSIFSLQTEGKKISKKMLVLSFWFKNVFIVFSGLWSFPHEKNP